MRKFFFWIIGIFVGVPVAIIVIGAFILFVYVPAKHAWNIHRMDKMNERVWEEGTARVATIETKMGTSKGSETLQTEIVCFDGHFAQPYTLKNKMGTGVGARSIGLEGMQADFPTGATLYIDLYWLCHEAMRMEPEDVPLNLEFSAAFVVAPALLLYCEFLHGFQPDEYLLHTDAGWVGYPHITAISERPLKEVAQLSEIGTSERFPVTSRFARAWGLDFNRSGWRPEDQCWGDRAGRCNDLMTKYCGTNPG